MITRDISDSTVWSITRCDNYARRGVIYALRGVIYAPRGVIYAPRGVIYAP